MHQEIRDLIKAGVRLITVHETTKIPFGKKWKDVGKLDELGLSDAMSYHQTNAVAIVCGKESDGVVCIDIDSKYNKDFHIIVFEALKQSYLDILHKLRIEITPSGGRHLIYKISGVSEYPKSEKLASRPSTDEELAKNPKEKSKCFIELRGEGGLCQTFPSYQYILTRRPLSGECIDTLTLEEHSILYNLCCCYNKIYKEVTVKIAKQFVEMYDVDPFVDFDKSEDAEKVLCDEGWKEINRTGQYIQFSRPGQTGKYVGATFNTVSRLYTIFTTSSSIDVGSIRPSILLRNLFFAGDGKQCYSELVRKGFGKLKIKIEERLIENSVKYGNALPANISEEGRSRVEKLQEDFNGMYPYGIFWELEGDTYCVSRLMVYNILDKFGFRISTTGEWWVRIEEKFITRVDDFDIFECLRNYIDKSETYFSEIFECVDCFLQKNGKYVLSQMNRIDKKLILSSTREVGYKGYRNGYVRVGVGVVELCGWETLEKLFWRHQIQDRDYVEGAWDSGLYYEYLRLCCGITDHLMKCIGYYAHEYKSTMTSYIVVLCEMTENPKNGGGTGKNIFTNLFGFTTSLLNRPGRNVKFDDTLLRTWKNQKVVSLNDVDKKFDYLGLKELSSGEGEVGKKYVQEETIANEDMPKFMVNTNYAFDPSGAGLKRRMIPLEFTEFFSKCGGVDVHFGKDFPSDKNSLGGWGIEDWIGYDNFIIKCIQKFIESGCKLTVPSLTHGGWKKQFEQKYSPLTLLFIEENISEWLKGEEGMWEHGKKGCVDIVGVFNVQYEKFCNENNVQKNFRLGSIKMNDALEEYCKNDGIKFVRSKNRKNSAGVQTNVKVFVREGEVVEEIEVEEEFNLF